MIGNRFKRRYDLIIFNQNSVRMGTAYIKTKKHSITLLIS